MFSIHAFFQNADFGGADTYLDAVPDQTVFTQGKLLRIPPGRAQLLAAAWGTAAATRNYARLETPSIRTQNNQYIATLAASAGLLADGTLQYHPDSPRELAVGEQAQFLVNTDDAAAQDHVAVLWLGDGPTQPVKGKIFTVRATAAITQAAGVWRQGVLTFQEQLPYGDYDVVGMFVVAATGSVGRLIFPQSEFRPGTWSTTSSNTNGIQYFRLGAMGVWGTFNTNQPPQLEMLGGTATAQTVYLDLIRRG